MVLCVGPENAAECQQPEATITDRSQEAARGADRNMAKKKGGSSKKKAETIFLVCEETGDYNYSLRRKPGGEKLKLKKYSPRLRRRTLHVEKKK